MRWRRRSSSGKAANRVIRGSAATVVTLAVLAGCSTGVDDEKGWRKVLDRNYPCAELVDIARDLPASVDTRMVTEDLRRAGCEPPANGPARP